MGKGIIVPYEVDKASFLDVSAPGESAPDAAQSQIDGAAGAATSTLIELLGADRPDKIRLEAAKTLLDRAGVSARPRAAAPAAPADLAALDLDQIQARLDRAESARAAAAIDVSASELARNDGQAIDPYS